MRRGTRVGQAYVAISADGSGINEDIVDSVEDAGPGVEKAGKEHGEKYGDEFGDSLRVKFSHVADSAGEELNRRMAGSADDGAKDYGDRFEKTMKKSAKRIGQSIGSSINEGLASSFKDAISEMEASIGRMIDTMDAKLKAAGSGGGGGALPPTSQGGTSGNLGPPPINQRRLEMAYRMDREFNRRNEKAKFDIISKFRKAIEKSALQSNKIIAKDEQDLIKYQQRLFDELQNRKINEDKELWRVRNLSAKAHYKYLADLEKGRIDQQGNNIRVSGNRDSALIGDRIGGLFGAGSRNNFLNLFGKSLANILNLTQKVGKGAQSMFSTFSKGFAQAGENASFFQKLVSGGGAVGSQIGAGLSKLAASGPAAAAAIAVITIALSAFVSIAGALVGILTALAATITSALAGALLVGAAGFSAFAASIGLVTIAFTNMTNAQSKALSSAFKPLKTELRQIAQLMLEDMVPAFDLWAKNLSEALALLAPVASVMGKAFAVAGGFFTNALSGPGFQKFFQTLATELPAITINLSSALGKFLNGLMATFAAVMPLVTRFSFYLSSLATRFSTWANSAMGQNAIVDFADRAVVSLMSLWNFVREFSGFVFDLLFSPQAQQAGNSMFDSLARSFAGFREAVARAAANGDLERWFSDARRFAGALKTMMIGLKDTFIALYNSGVLEGIANGLRSLGRFMTLLAPNIAIVVNLFGKIAPVVLNAMGPLVALIDAFSRLSGVVQGAMGPLGAFSGMSINVGGFLGPLGALASSFLNVGNSASAAASRVNAFLILRDKFNFGKPKKVGDRPIITAAIGGKFDPIKLPTINPGDYGGGGGGGGGGGDGGAGKAAAAARRKAVREALESLAKAIRDGMRSIREASSGKEAREGIRSLMDTIKEAADAANRTAKQVNKAIAILTKQKKIRDTVVDRLVAAGKIGNATLSELAAARNIVADKLEKAKQKLQDAISLRDDFRKSVADSVRSYGSLLTAQGKTIDGVAQALTADDITSNLQTRLDKIRKFQDDLRLLIAQGLSNEAYKQLVEAGVEDGGAAAAALLQGGLSSITQVNDLVGLIGSAANELGLAASNRMYQAGVDAAKGLVAGLTSLSAQLNSAATQLGLAIAKALKNALGIHSPSRLMIDMMEDVGDGLAVGLGNQNVKVGAAAGNLAKQIAVSPEVAAYARRQGTTTTDEGETVSGNTKDPRFRDLIVNTPTEDPEAVAMEVLNEVTGRL